MNKWCEIFILRPCEAAVSLPDDGWAQCTSLYIKYMGAWWIACWVFFYGDVAAKLTTHKVFQVAPSAKGYGYATCFRQDLWGHRFYPTHSPCSKSLLGAPTPCLLGFLLTIDHSGRPHLTKENSSNHQCLQIPCIALRGSQGLLNSSQNGLFGNVTAIGTNHECGNCL